MGITKEFPKLLEYKQKFFFSEFNILFPWLQSVPIVQLMLNISGKMLNKQKDRKEKT